MRLEYNYCPRCGQALQQKQAFGQVRPVCDACGFVHFQDPKVAVSALIDHEGRVLLVRRAVVPRIGYWALPAGFMDAGELPHETIVREVLEETGLRITPGVLLDIMPMANPDKPGFLMVYRAHLVGGTLTPQDDISEASWFAPHELPWSDLAFESTHTVLRRWQDEGGWKMEDA